MGFKGGTKFLTFHRGTAAYQLVCFRSQISNPVGLVYRENPIMLSFNVILFALILNILLSRTIQLLLKPLRQPRLVCQLIGGVMMGPSLLARHKSFTSLVFPFTSDFVLENLGRMGVTLFLFVIGVKMDLGLLKRSGKKHLYIALASVFGPLLIVSIVAVLTKESMDEELARVSSIGEIALSLSVTTFPVHYTILEELNLLRSEVGNMALSIALISDAIGINFMVVFEAMKQGDSSAQSIIWYSISCVVMAAFTPVIRRAMVWIIEQTQEGEAVDQFYVIAILLGSFVAAFVTDMFGLGIANGSFWLGLMMPDGRPLGSTLVQKSETIITEVFMPCSFVFMGLSTDFYAMKEAGWSALRPLFGLVISGYLSKFFCTMLAAKAVGVSWRDSLAVSLILSLRGYVELVLYVHWVDRNVIGLPGYSLMILGTIVVVGILTPLISILYDPSKPYMLKQRRTIQHTAQGDHLRILVCIRDKTNLPSLVNLLQLFHPTVQNPFSLHAFYLVELISRANPVFVEHQNQELEDLSGRFPDLEIIHHALKQYQEGREECVELHLFSAATVKPTMYQDVCKLALISKAVFIILPLKKKLAGEMETTEQWGGESGSIITQILDNAPCSVGLLVEKAERWQLPQIASYNFIVLFLGGPDSREALAFSDRMSGNPCVSLTVVRFLASNAEGDDEMQRKLDDGVVTSFWVKNEANEKVNYREVVIRNGADTASAIVGMAAEKYYHMWIVGRKQGINPSLLEGLSTWSDHKEEMGILGDYLSFSESVNSDSVMVVQKQVLTGKGPNFFTPPGSIVSFMRRGRLFW
ncbi:hypothetical protein PVK06_014582 [Gossypium arboreum]|uniref:Cation/H+ exchanger transmembrane domain-containing protein n=2 Tax=Gossypium arboreum TaxID=29729 RepID=A0ABR0PUY8_GOSAR|nr:hypothetical protein PVK06_014582 [Gossypium arboreum]